jgi:hypothetical protein
LASAIHVQVAGSAVGPQRGVFAGSTLAIGALLSLLNWAGVVDW